MDVVTAEANTSGALPPSPLHTMATTTTTTTTTTTPTTVVEEGKLLSESLATVKIQVGQMKRHLVRCASAVPPSSPARRTGDTKRISVLTACD